MTVSGSIATISNLDIRQRYLIVKNLWLSFLSQLSFSCSLSKSEARRFEMEPLSLSCLAKGVTGPARSDLSRATKHTP